MKRLIAVLILLSMARIGVAYADTSNNTQSYFFGVKNAAANLNQVLALLVGPQGKPGPAGVAGKDGLIGLNGVDGKDGLPGAPGAAGAPGRDGEGVIAVAFTGVQGNCSNGGVRFTAANGSETFACNGTAGSVGPQGATGATGPQGPQGATGATGPQGPQGPAGSGSGGGSLGFGQGEVTAGACEADGKIVISLDRIFTGTDFVFNKFKFGDPSVTDGDIKDTCATEAMNIYFKIGTGTLKNTSGNYSNNEIIKCSYTLPAAAGWPNAKWQFELSAGNLTCTNTSRTPNSAVSFSEISTADYTDVIGFEIG